MVHIEIDREKTIREIIAILTALEKCSDQEIENVKKSLRWISDNAMTSSLNVK